MGWSDQFVDKLMKARTWDPIWALEVLSVGNAPHITAAVFTSVPMTGCTAILGLKGVRVQGSTLNLASRTATVGAFSVDIVGDARAVFRTVTRGTWVRVRCGFPGWPLEDFQTVAVGRVQNIRGAPPSWTIECLDWKSALRSRNDPDDPNLFYNIGTTTAPATTADGAWTQNTSPLTVVDTTDFPRETSGTGAVKVNDAFYLLWTSKTGTTFTVNTADKFATLQADLVGGEDVKAVAYLSGHPIDIARKILASTGLGWNGDYDTYPSAWGYAIPDYLFDHDDTDRWRDEIVVTATGAYTCELVVDEAKDDGGSWLEGWLKEHGIVLAVRQGAIVLRALSGSITLPDMPGDPVAVITDDDISCYDRIQWEGWDSDYSAEYCWLKSTSTQHDAFFLEPTSGNVAAATLPAIEEAVVDLSESVRDNTQSDLIHDNVLDRLSVFATRIPERVRMRLPIRYAQLAICDLVFLSTTRVYGRQDDGAYDGRASTAIQVSPNWIEGYCDVSVSVRPTSEEEWTA